MSAPIRSSIDDERALLGDPRWRRDYFDSTAAGGELPKYEKPRRLPRRPDWPDWPTPPLAAPRRTPAK